MKRRLVAVLRYVLGPLIGGVFLVTAMSPASATSFDTSPDTDIGVGSDSSTADSDDSTSTTAPPAPSQQATFSVSPAIVDNTADPGASLDTTVTVTNAGAEPIAVRTSVSPFLPDETIDPDEQALYDASSWFTVVTPTFALLGQESKEVKIHTQFPVDASPGGHYATVQIEAYVSSQLNAAGTVNAQIGVLMLMTVTGDIVQRATGQSIKTSHFQIGGDKTTAQASLHNDGNVHLLPSGTAVVKDMFGDEVARVPMSSGLVLPGAARDVTFPWERKVTFGVYRVSAVSTFGSPRTEVNLGSTWFIVISTPLLVGLGVVFGVILCLVLTLYVQRLMNRVATPPNAAHIRRRRRSDDEEEDAGRPGPSAAADQPDGSGDDQGDDQKAGEGTASSRLEGDDV